MLVCTTRRSWFGLQPYLCRRNDRLLRLECVFDDHVSRVVTHAHISHTAFRCNGCGCGMSEYYCVCA